jgi:hypothetical protein
MPPLRPRSSAALGHMPSPGRRRAQDASAFPRHGAVRAPCTWRTASPSAALPIRSVRGAPWYGGIFAVTATSRSGALFKHHRSLPPATPSRRPPLPPSRQARLLASIPGRLTILTYSLGSLEACAVAHLPGIAPPRRSRNTPRSSPPAVAMRRRRVPFCPNFEHQRALGELTLLPTPFPGRSPRRSRRNLASRAAGHGQGPHCKGSNLSRGLSAKLKLQ